MANPLYPVFLKLHQLQTLVVGAGVVGHEKLSLLLKSSPRAQLTVVAPEVSAPVRALLVRYPHVRLLERPFAADDLEGMDLVIAATGLPALGAEVRREARARGVLVNVADTPQACDFYLGAIVTRGDLKVAISTNGRSPTFARRFRELLEESLPEDVDELLVHLHALRQRMQGDFASKVAQLNQLTAGLLASDQDHSSEAPTP